MYCMVNKTHLYNMWVTTYYLLFSYSGSMVSALGLGDRWAEALSRPRAETPNQNNNYMIINKLNMWQNASDRMEIILKCLSDWPPEGIFVIGVKLCFKCEGTWGDSLSRCPLVVDHQDIMKWCGLIYNANLTVLTVLCLRYGQCLWYGQYISLQLYEDNLNITFATIIPLD